MTELEVIHNVFQKMSKIREETAALRERLNRAIELPFFQKDGEVIVLIYKNKDGVVLTETYFEDEYYDGKRGNEAAEARLAELKRESGGKEERAQEELT